MQQRDGDVAYVPDISCDIVVYGHQHSNTYTHIRRTLLSATSRTDHVFGCVCVSVCDRFAKQHVSKNNFRIFAKFTADVPYRLPWKWLTPGADVVQDG